MVIRIDSCDVYFLKSNIKNENFLEVWSWLKLRCQSCLAFRLPIIQGATFALLKPTMEVLSMDRLSCNIEYTYSGNNSNTSGSTSKFKFLGNHYFWKTVKKYFVFPLFSKPTCISLVHCWQPKNIPKHTLQWWS